MWDPAARKPTVWGSSKHLFLLTWPAVLCTLLVDHLLDSASKQHSWRVMVKGLERLAGAVGFLSGHTAGSLLLVSRGGGVTALPILVSLAVSLSVSLALGQRAERPLLPHPFHAACMLGIQLPPLHRRRSPETLASGLTFSFLPPPLPPAVVILVLSRFYPQTPLPTSEPLPVTSAVLEVFHPFHLEKKKQSSDNTNPSASSSKAHTYPLLNAPPPPPPPPPPRPENLTCEPFPYMTSLL